MGKVSTTAEFSRSLRKALGGVTQAELATKLLVSRNYISQIEASLKTPSPRLRAQMEQMFAESAKMPDKVSNSGDRGDTAQGHEQSAADALRREINDETGTMITAAGDDLGRLGWLLEELRRLRPDSWDEDGTALSPDHERAIRATLSEEKRRGKERSA